MLSMLGAASSFGPLQYLDNPPGRISDTIFPFWLSCFAKIHTHEERDLSLLRQCHLLLKQDSTERHG